MRGSQTLYVDLNAFEITNESGCGSVSVSARIDGSSSDPFVTGDAYATPTRLSFDPSTDFTALASSFDVTIDVFSTENSAVAFSYTVSFEVINCELEAMTISNPALCPTSLDFPTFYFQYQWGAFTYIDQPGCIVSKYKVTVIDPHGK